MKLLTLCFFIVISSSAFAQINSCNKDQVSKFSTYIDDRITSLDKQIKDGSWSTSEDYSAYDECRLKSLLDIIKDYGPSSRAFYCDVALDFCSDISKEKTSVLQRYNFPDCGKETYIPFAMKRSDCSNALGL